MNVWGSGFVPIIIYGSGIADSMEFAILTESGSPILTESGSILVTENAP